MSARVTNADLAAVAENLNRRLEGFRSPARVVVEHRYDYFAVDETDEAGRVRRTLTTGLTKREAYEAMWNMIRALDLIESASDEQCPERDTRCLHEQAGREARCNGGGYDGCACGPYRRKA